MSPAAQGVYDTLWLESWNEKVPGQLPSDERLLACLAGVTQEVWKSVAEEVRTGFEVSADMWICKGAERTKEEQDAWRTRWRRQKRRQRIRGADSPPLSATASSNGTGSGSGAGTGSGSGRELEPTHLSADADVRESSQSKNGHGPRTARRKPKPDSEWEQAFHEQFWPEWLKLGRACSRADAFTAWSKLPHPEGEADFNRLMDALEAAVAVWRDERRETRHYPHAATWLNDYHRNLVLTP